MAQRREINAKESFGAGVLLGCSITEADFSSASFGCPG